MERRIACIFGAAFLALMLLASLTGCLNSVAFRSSERVSVLEAAPFHTKLLVTWEEDPLAGFYNVYYAGVDEAPPSAPQYSGVTGTEAVITGLTNGREYHVWVEAVYGGGDTALNGYGRGTPLARDHLAEDEGELAAALAAINTDTTFTEYRIVLNADIPMSSGCIYIGKYFGPGVTVTIEGRGGMRTITGNTNYAYGVVINGNTLILGNNVTLDGRDFLKVVGITGGGKFTMRDGSRITNGSTGVYMNMGTFTMEGGEISENDQSVWMASGAGCRDRFNILCNT